MNVNIVLLLLLMFTSSCAYLLDRLDSDFGENAPLEIKPESKQTYCPKGNSYNQLVSENKRSHETFNRFLVQVESVDQLKFIDKAVLWSLVQMNLRPDLSSPHSRMQMLIYHGGKEHFLNYYNKNVNSWSYLYALESLLNKFKSKHSLQKLARFIDNLYPDLFYVSEDFAAFLKSKKDMLLKYPALKRIYIRGDETLKTNERITKQPLVPIIKRYLRYKKHRLKIKFSDYLFTYDKQPRIKANCNYDMGLYSSSIYLINKNFIQSNVFGLKNGNSAFLASSTQGMDKFTPLKASVFFQGKGDARTAAICSFKEKMPGLNKRLWLVSSASRDPGQHIYHLLEYGLHDVDQLQEMDKMIKFSRHLFLQNPVRLIFESNRSTNQQLEELLKLDIPIYYANNLGKIWGYYKDKKSHSFLLDDRKTGSLACSTR
jgi:hypothetical protein